MHIYTTNYTNNIFIIVLVCTLLTACGGSSNSSPAPMPPLEPKDTTPPVITLNGESTVTIAVNDIYTDAGASASDDTDGNVQVTMASDLDTATVGTYTLTYSASDSAGNSTTATRTVNVIQLDTTPPVITLSGASRMTLLVDEDYVELGASATDDVDEAIEITIEGNVDTASIGTYTLTYRATDVAGNSATISRVIEILERRPFITTWRTDIREAFENEGFSNDDQIMISTLGDGYDYHVDWGDGTVDENVTGNITHTYAAKGVYTVTISGKFPQLYFPPSEHDGEGGEIIFSDTEKLLSVEQWGTNQWRSMHRAFAGCEAMVINATDKPDLSNVTDMSYMFYRATSFNHDIGNWDLSKVTNISYMLAYTSNFNQDISAWNVANVTNMEGLFLGGVTYNGYTHPTAFNGDISNWDVSNVTNMSKMFRGASAFSTEINTWDVSSVTNMSAMFSSAFLADVNFNGDISDWDVSNVTDMSFMFNENREFNQDISRWDVSNVNNMRAMFEYAVSFSGAISSWNVSNIEDMSIMFRGVKLTTDRYDSILQNWSSLSLQEGVSFDAGESQYSSSSQSFKDFLLNEFNWKISDKGSIE